MVKHKKIVIGIDQSYTASGISIAIDGRLIKCTSTSYKGLGTNSEKRLHIRDIIGRLLNKASQKAHETIIICERIRTFSSFGKQGFKKGGPPQGLNPGYLKMTGALIATVVDIAFEYGVKVYSVDTRSWKAQIVGSSKARQTKGKRDAKSETVEFIQKLGFDLFVREKSRGKNKGEKIYDDDAADSGCIALYGFLPKAKQSLLLEK